jgi:ABC-type lipoprotein export system ATPase subunit
LIRIEDVARRYVMGDVTVTALEDVALDVAAGEFIVVLGPSGSGKTTLLNMIGALDSPTSGSIVIAGHDITHATRKELFAFRRTTVSFIFQSFNLFPGLTALENVEFGVDAAGRPNPRETAFDMLTRVGLGERLRHFPHELSQTAFVTGHDFAVLFVPLQTVQELAGLSGQVNDVDPSPRRMTAQLAGIVPRDAVPVGAITGSDLI